MAIVSVVMPTYNGEKYIAQQLQSLSEQTFKDFKLIVTDDNSSDNTISVIKQFKDKFEIKIVKNEKNLGYNKNFEKAISLADTEYIAMCDQDDIWHKDKLSLLLENIKENSLIYANSHLIDEDGTSLGISLSQKLKSNFISTHSVLPFIYANCVSGHASLFKKELIPYILPFPKKIYYDLWIAVNAASLNGVKYLDKDLVDYRQHVNSVVTKEKLDKKKDKPKRVNKREKLHTDSIDTIEEILKSKLLKEDERKLLEQLKLEHSTYGENWINPALFSLLNKNKNKIFAISPKTYIKILRKYYFSKYTYKYFPI